jgi:hypothetical protein
MWKMMMGSGELIFIINWRMESMRRLIDVAVVLGYGPTMENRVDEKKRILSKYAHPSTCQKKYE